MLENNDRGEPPGAGVDPFVEVVAYFIADLKGREIELPRFYPLLLSLNPGVDPYQVKGVNS